MDQNVSQVTMNDSTLTQEQASILHVAQSRAERIELRKSYRRLIQETQDNKEELVKPDCNGLVENIAKAQDLFEKVKEASEGALDSRFMSLAVSLGAQKTSLLQTDLVAFQPDEFVEKLISFMGGTLSDDSNEVHIPDSAWSNLGDALAPYFTSIVPALHPLSGAFDYGNAQSKNTCSKKQPPPNKEVPGKAQLPQHLTNYHSNKKEATPEEIERVYNKIRRVYSKEPIPIDYFELVVNPESYGHTVENIFHLSFLVKDGLVKIFIGDSGLPVVELIKDINSTSPTSTQESTNTQSNQAIVSLSYDEWEAIVDAYELKGRPSFIPTPRPRVDGHWRIALTRRN